MDATNMDAANSDNSPAALKFPAGMIVQPIGPALRLIGEAMGLKEAPTGQLSDLPPWTKEEADAFERSINEICEQIDP